MYVYVCVRVKYMYIYDHYSQSLDARAFPVHIYKFMYIYDHYSQSLDAREKLWIKQVHEPAIGAECRNCGYATQQHHAKRNMVAHLKRPENKECLKLYSDSADPREMAWVCAVQDPV